MNHNIDEIQKLWQAEKSQKSRDAGGNAATLIKEARHRRAGSIRFQYGNVTVLALVLAGIFYFFSIYLGLSEALSLIGLFMMYGGLVLRIVVEIYSIVYAGRIDISKSSLVNTEKILAYYQFRRGIHGPVTLSIVGLYTVGFYMLIPEFLMYLSTFWVSMIGASYLLMAIFPFWQIRKGILEEIRQLEEIVKIRKMLLDNQSVQDT